MKREKSYLCRIVKKEKTCKSKDMKNRTSTMDNNMQFDKRKHESFNFPYTIECFYPCNDEIIKGIAFDISKSGICLYIPQSLDKGQEIRIKSVAYDFPQNAVVCWSEKYDEAYYKVECCLHNDCY